jgi:hypothetical protein
MAGHLLMLPILEQIDSGLSFTVRILDSDWSSIVKQVKVVGGPVIQTDKSHPLSQTNSPDAVNSNQARSEGQVKGLRREISMG